MRDKLNAIGETAAIAFLATVLFAALCGVFLFRGRGAFDVIDNFLEKYDLADIERGEA